MVKFGGESEGKSWSVISSPSIREIRAQTLNQLQSPSLPKLIYHTSKAKHIMEPMYINTHTKPLYIEYQCIGRIREQGRSHYPFCCTKKELIQGERETIRLLYIPKEYV